MATKAVLDIFASKGPEYLLTIAFLFVLIIFWRFLFERDAKMRSAIKIPANENGRYNTSKQKTPAGLNNSDLKTVDGFLWDSKLYYHPGHTWLAKCGENMLVTGLDDFAQRLIGKVKLSTLPKPGDKLTIGKPAFSVEIEGKSIPVLSAASGNIAEINPELSEHPEMINTDPYNKGWLFKIYNDDVPSAINNLMYGPASRFWMQFSAERLFRKILPDADLAMADGGMLIDNLNKINPDVDPAQLVSEFLLTGEMEKAG